MTNVTYGHLDRVLRARNFSVRLLESEPRTRVYEHPQTGALIALPALPDTQEVYPHHLVMVRGTLDNFGIASPLDFARELERAS